MKHTHMYVRHVGPSGPFPMARSRRAANELAEARLELPRTKDEDILAILQRWYFKHNTTRKNVLPEGVTSLQSDTLGVVRTEPGLWFSLG